MQDTADVKYKPGDRVRVADRNPGGHCRTPWYVRGKVGRVVQFYGAFGNPESQAYGGSGLPKQPLYQVKFDQIGVWARYKGPPKDAICVDVFQHWLEPISLQGGVDE